MMPFNRFRLLHWGLAAAFLAAYLSGDEGELVHVWLGYALLAALGARLVAALARLSGFMPLGPTRAMWRQPGLALVGRLMTVSLLCGALASGATGLMLVDNAGAIGATLSRFVPAAHADDGGAGEDGAGGDGERSDAIKEWHEAASNLTLGLAGLHIAYVLAFRRSLALALIRGVRRREGRAAPLEERGA